MLDVKITRGLVFDGTGAHGRLADVGIMGDAIIDIGDLSSVPARKTIDAEGKYVCPGFIDVHSHSDAYLLIQPDAVSKIYQGVTTEIVGQCGASASPLQGEYKMPSDWRDKKFPKEWHSAAEYRAALEEIIPAVNVGFLTGHNAIRAGVMGYEPRQASADDLAAMKRLLEKCLNEGSRGFSTGLVYPPGSCAEPSEIWELARVVAKHEGIYASHMRSEGAGLIEAVEETIEVCRRTGVRTQISHLKTSGLANWSKIDRVLEIIRAARAEGLPVMSDRYPYTASSTDLDIVLPAWASTGGPDIVLGRIRDAATRAKILAELKKSRADADWERIMIGSVSHPDHADYPGLRLPEIADKMKLHPAEALLQIIEKDELKTGGIFFGMSEENMWRILSEPYVMIGSDASIRAPAGPLSADHPHPRAYGAFPRFIRKVIDEKRMSVQEAICKMTSLPAEHFKLQGRGRLAKGFKADITVFDPEKIADRATFAKPHQPAAGMDAVLVNGCVTLLDGNFTGQRSGSVLAG